MYVCIYIYIYISIYIYIYIYIYMVTKFANVLQWHFDLEKTYLAYMCHKQHACSTVELRWATDRGGGLI